jgi:UV DNA damage endonuclease
VAILRERGLSAPAPNLPVPPLNLPPDPNAPAKAKRTKKVAS